MFNFNPRERSVQGGYIGNAGAPDTPDMNNEETTRRQEPSYPMFGPGSMGMIGANIEEATRRNEPSFPMFGPGSMGMIGGNIKEATRRNEPSFPMFGPGSMGMIGGNIGNVGSMAGTLRGNPYGSSTQTMSNTQQAKEAGFDKKTVS